MPLSDIVEGGVAGRADVLCRPQSHVGLAKGAAAATGCWRHIFLELYQLVEVDLVVALHQSHPLP